jgi:putative SOS response-associated peptidase YedK
MKEPGKIRPINARAETIHQKPMFRDAFRHQRCLVLCDGYYEWKKLANGRKQPYHLGRTDGSPFVMAGLWSDNAHAASEGIQTFCVITTPASGEAATIHHRMPVILPRAAQTQWLDPLVSKTEQVQELLLNGDVDLSVYPVSTFVNSPANNSAKCAIRLAESVTGAN